MSKLIKYLQQILLVVIVMTASLSCQKEAGHEQSKHKTFLRVTSDPNTDYATFISETSDGGIFAAGIGGEYGGMVRYRYDAYGHPFVMDSFEADAGFVFGTRLKGGGFVLGSLNWPQVVRVSEDGAVLANRWFDPTFNSGGYRFSRIIEGDSSNALFVAYTNGPMNVAPSSNFISELTYDGVESRFFKISDAMFGGKVQQLNVVRAKGNLLWLSGSFFNKTAWSWADPVKSFVAIYDINTNQIIKIHYYDINDDSESDYVISVLGLTDGSIISLVSGAYFARDGIGYVCPEFEVFCTSENGDPVWRKRINIGALSAYPMEIRPMSDGGFLITGYCLGSGFVFTRPFMVRLDKNGEVITQKIILYLGPSEFVSCSETSDHRFLFAGYSYTHGSGKEDANSIIVATDIEGNLE